MSQVKFASDLHLGHRNIHKFRTQFASAEEHDDFVKDKVLSAGGKRTSIWLLGDTIFYDKFEDHWLFMEDLVANYAQVKLVLGNHCTQNRALMDNILRYIRTSNRNSVEIYGLAKKYNAWLSHAPIHPAELRGKYNIHGHVHSNTLPDKRYLNVSLENINYEPITLDQVRDYFNGV